MRAAIYHSNADVRVTDVPVPAIGPGEALMRVEASGICGSDVVEWHRKRKAPLVLGHEVAGKNADAEGGRRRPQPFDRSAGVRRQDGSPSVRS